MSEINNKKDWLEQELEKEAKEKDDSLLKQDIEVKELLEKVENEAKETLSDGSKDTLSGEAKDDPSGGSKDGSLGEAKDKLSDEAKEERFSFERPAFRRSTTQKEETVSKETVDPGEKDERHLVDPSGKRRRVFAILGITAFIIVIILFLLSDRIFNSMQGKSSYMLTETDKAVTYIEGNTSIQTHKGKLLRCSQDGLQALNESGSVAWDIPFTMSSPFLVTAGDYISVADRLGMSLLIINNGKIVTEITTESQLLLNCVNDKGMSAAVLDASGGHMVNLYSLEGETLMQRRTYSTTDGIPMAVALSADGSRMGTVYVNYTGAVMTSILTIFDLTETGSSLVDRIVGSVSFEDTLISDIKFVGDQCFYAGTDRLGAVSCRTAVEIQWENKVSYAIEALALSDEFFAVRYGEGLAGTVLPAEYNIVSYNYKGDVLAKRNVENVNYLDAWGDTFIYGSGRYYEALSSTGKPKWTLQSYEEYSRMVQFDSDKTVAALRSGVIRFYKVTLKGVGEDEN